jgi:flagellar motor switch protein FliG
MAQNGSALARITPTQRMVARDQAQAGPRTLTRKEKAAIIVHCMLAEGAPLQVSSLSDSMQTALTEQMSQMRLVDKETLSAVVSEFLTELEEVGIAFPGGMEGALAVMKNHLSPDAASRLRRMASGHSRSDPWERLVQMPVEQILPALQDESVEVAAVVLSKLPVPKAADLLSKLPGDRARRVALAVSMTSKVAPETVRRIGTALLLQLDSQPPKAFDTGPVERVGAILNVAASGTRDDVLKGLDAEDADFAEQVRKAIFTFAHIPTRIVPRDVPKIIRGLDQAVLVTALSASLGKPGLEETAEFILANLSQRMTQGLREEMLQRGKIKDKDAEEAMTAVVIAVRALESTGEVVLITPEDG